MYYYKYIYIYIDIYLFYFLEKNISSRVISGIFLHIPPFISKLSSVICHCTIIFSPHVSFSFHFFFVPLHTIVL